MSTGAGQHARRLAERMRPGQTGHRELHEHQLRFRLGGARHVTSAAVRSDRCAAQVLHLLAGDHRPALIPRPVAVALGPVRLLAGRRTRTSGPPRLGCLAPSGGRPRARRHDSATSAGRSRTSLLRIRRASRSRPITHTPGAPCAARTLSTTGSSSPLAGGMSCSPVHRRTRRAMPGPEPDSPATGPELAQPGGGVADHSSSRVLYDGKFTAEPADLYEMGLSGR